MIEDWDIVQEFLTQSFEDLEDVEQTLVQLESALQNNLLKISQALQEIQTKAFSLDLSGLASLAQGGIALLGKLGQGLELDSSLFKVLITLMDLVKENLLVLQDTGRESQRDCSDFLEFLFSLSQREGAVEEGEILSVLGQLDLQRAREEIKEDVVDSNHSESHIRVEVNLLDKLMALIGELVLARNQILQYSTQKKETLLGPLSQRLNLITSELQERMLKTRMQPLHTLLNHLPRIVRDRAKTLNKKVYLEMTGGEAEVDKSILEGMEGPLAHLVLGALDHGIESPEERKRLGKAEEGHLFVKAFQESGQINIEITDDGIGIDPQEVRKRVLGRSLMDYERLSSLSDQEVLNLLFLSGFRNKKEDDSEMGLSVAKNQIEKIGGTVDLHSKAGEGTTFRVKIPLTQVIITSLIVSNQGLNYAIPQIHLVELIRLEGDRAKKGIESFDNTSVYRLRDRLIPLLFLSREFGREASPLYVNPETGLASLSMVILQAGSRQFGLVVDKIIDTQEVVVKSLGKHMKDISIYTGATILGDGKVALILDILRLALKAHVVSEEEDWNHLEGEVTEEDEKIQLLIFQLEKGGKGVIPLSKTARLERIPLSLVERSGNYDVIQYREGILPLIYVSSLLRGASAPSMESLPDPMQVVIYRGEKQNVGLVVGQIQDIVEGKRDIHPCVNREGILGTLVIQGKVADFLDIPMLTAKANPPVFENLTVLERSEVNGR